MKQVLLKTIVIVVGKSRSKVLQDRAGLHRVSRGGDETRKFSPSCRAMQGWGKTKPCRAGVKILTILRPHSGPLSSLCHMACLGSKFDQ